MEYYGPAPIPGEVRAKSAQRRQSDWFALGSFGM
jgi:hypothetical protein